MTMTMQTHLSPPRGTHRGDSHSDFPALSQLLHRHLPDRDQAHWPWGLALPWWSITRHPGLEHVGASGVRCLWYKACLVLAGGHALGHFTDQMADEHMGFLDAWH